MKKIKFIPTILAAVALVFSSCVVDDDHPVSADPSTDIEVSLSPAGVTFVPTSQTSYTLNVDATNSFPESGLVEYNINGVDDGLVISGNSGSFTFDMAAGYYNVELSDVVAENAVANNVLTSINQNAKSAQIISYDLPAANSTSIQFILSWANLNHDDGNGGNDLDLMGFDDPVTYGWFGPDTWGYSWAYDTYEYISMPVSASDGNYIIGTAAWIGEDPTIPVSVTVIYPNANPGVDPDVVETYNSVIPGTDYYAEYDQLLKFSKSGDTFTITEVMNPAVAL